MSAHRLIEKMPAPTLAEFDGEVCFRGLAAANSAEGGFALGEACAVRFVLKRSSRGLG